MAIVIVGNNSTGTDYVNVSVYDEARFWGGAYTVTVEAGDTLVALGYGEMRAGSVGGSVAVALYTDEGSEVFNLIAKHTFVFPSTSNYTRETEAFNIDLTPYEGLSVIIAVGEWSDARALVPTDSTGEFHWNNSSDTLDDPYTVVSGYVTDASMPAAWAEIERGPVGPTIDNIDGDDVVEPGQTATINITGDIGAVQGTGGVELRTSDGTTVVAQTVTAWNNGA